MFKKLNICFFIAISIMAISSDITAQMPDYNGLVEYVNKERHAPDAIKIIVKHLEQSATIEPLEELIRWTNGGFPELHDKNNYWNTEPYSIYLCIVSSINYYFSVSNSPDKAKNYLQTIERLKNNDTIIYHLTQTTYKILDEQELEKEFLRLVNLDDSKERARGLNLGRTIAEKKRGIFNKYVQILKQDQDGQVRNTALHVLGLIRRNYSKEVAFVALEQLLIEKDSNARKIASTLVKQGADLRLGWAKEDSPFLLSQMLKTDDIFVRKTIGVTVAILTTEDKYLRVDEENIPENLFDKFIDEVKLKQSNLKRNLEPDELLADWENWWNPLIKTYTVESRAVSCG